MVVGKALACKFTGKSYAEKKAILANLPISQDNKIELYRYFERMEFYMKKDKNGKA